MRTRSTHGTPTILLLLQLFAAAVSTLQTSAGGSNSLSATLQWHQEEVGRPFVGFPLTPRLSSTQVARRLLQNSNKGPLKLFNSDSDNQQNVMSAAFVCPRPATLRSRTIRVVGGNASGPAVRSKHLRTFFSLPQVQKHCSVNLDAFNCTSVNARHRLQTPSTGQVCRSSLSHRRKYTGSSMPSGVCIRDLGILEDILSPSRSSIRPQANKDSGGAPSDPPGGDVTPAGAERVILLVLNQAVPPYFDRLLRGASLVVAADGAANHLLPLYRSIEDNLQRRQANLKAQGQSLRESSSRRLVRHKPSSFLVHPSRPGADRLSSLWSDVQSPQLPACICGDLDSSTPEASKDTTHVLLGLVTKRSLLNKLSFPVSSRAL